MLRIALLAYLAAFFAQVFDAHSSGICTRNIFAAKADTKCRDPGRKSEGKSVSWYAGGSRGENRQNGQFEISIISENTKLSSMGPNEPAVFKAGCGADKRRSASLILPGYPIFDGYEEVPVAVNLQGSSEQVVHATQGLGFFEAKFHDPHELEGLVRMIAAREADEFSFRAIDQDGLVVKARFSRERNKDSLALFEENCL